MISFIIPTLNEASSLEKTLDCISAYSGDKEIIISDGKSTDATIEIAKKYTDKIIIYNGTQRQTIGMGRNLWASIANGEYLVFLDADVSIFDPDVFFARAISIMDETSDSVAITAYIRVLPEWETTADKYIFGTLNNVYFILNNILHIGGASGEFQMVRTEAFRKAGWFDEVLIGGEDHEHFRRLARIGRTISAKDLTIFHTGRRAHTIGWPKLLSIWAITMLPMSIRKFILKEWSVIR